MSQKLDRIFAALSDPNRRAILRMLVEDDMAVTDVAMPFDISLAAVSKHLRVLAEAGLITQERRGRVVWCKLLPDELDSAAKWMTSLGVLEPINYDQLEALIEEILMDRKL